jgi:putative CocE/NonD family hydrolase
MARHAEPRAALAAFFLAVCAIPMARTTAAPAAVPDNVQLPDQAEIDGYVGHDVMIPMRDGRKLHAEVWRPKDVTGQLPILMQRSPYGYGLARVRNAFAGELKELAQEKFIFVLEDIRGRFGSEGDFVMQRPLATGASGVDESTDTFDSIDWLVRTLPDNNGKVGVFGISYLGWTTAMATINPHPALKAVSVQASPEDMFLGDDFHHNGAFRLDYGWEYAATLETDGRTLNPFAFGQDDPYGWFLKQPSLADLDRRVLGKPLPTWRNFVAHPNYDNFWQSEATGHNMPARPQVPDLIVAGWWDQEDFFGPLSIYKKQAKQDDGRVNSIVIGPWNHGGWSKPAADHYGPYPLGSDTSGYFRGAVETPWFRYWLKGDGPAPKPGALVFETGSNQWRHYSAWPPADGVIRKTLYFHQGGLLSFAPPEATEGADRFVSDPANPVPYRARLISQVMGGKGSTWPVWLADDQVPFSKRADVLTWQTAPLTDAVTLRGDVVARLFASTTGRDADWIVKLIDLYPDDEATPADLRGRGLMIADEVFRGRFRKSFEHPAPLQPGKVLDYTIDLHGASHVFQKGHRILVQVQSSWFPLIDRNPQTFPANIFEAQPADYVAQTHAVFHTAAYPSGLEVDVAP